MNLGQNKFLVGLSVAMVAGCGTLGYLLFTSYSQYSDCSQRYETMAGDLMRLERLPLYPEAGNLKKLDQKKNAAAASAESLYRQLAPLSFPLEQITPEQFQDQLRAAVAATAKKAEVAGVKLPVKFYLGFDNYQTLPPKAEAAPVLGRQLKAVDLAVQTLIDSKVDAITAITRELLAEEGDAAKANPQPGAAKVAVEKAPLVSKYPFKIDFTAEQNRFRNALNALAKNGKQFFILRPVTIKNDVEKPLSRAEANPTPKPGAMAAMTTTTGTPGMGSPEVKEEEPALRYIVGTEKVNVGLRLDMVVFASSFSK